MASADIDTTFSNTTSPQNASSIPRFADDVVEIFIPGYRFYSNILNNALGFDLTLIGTAFLALWALYRASRFLSSELLEQLEPIALTRVRIDAKHDLHTDLLEALVADNILPLGRDMQLAPPRSMLTQELLRRRAHDDGGIFDARTLDLQFPLEFTLPVGGVFGFWYRWRYFRVERREEVVVLTCFSRSDRHVRGLLHDCRVSAARRADRHIGVYRAEYDRWTRRRVKQLRELDTVDIDAVNKRRIVRDMNEYLQPAAREWYHQRGIPWRRGYLFSGPPGVGKTSLCIALASFFGLDIYTLSLLDPQLRETNFLDLFADVPEHSLILLEDIDSAGLERGAEVGIETYDASGDGAGEGQKRPRSRISLSGLLNAIDGVSSPHGAVLVMTTNHPEALDPALLRPGRTDMHVEFRPVGASAAATMFRRMYHHDDIVARTITNARAAVMEKFPIPSEGKLEETNRDEAGDRSEDASESEDGEELDEGDNERTTAADIDLPEPEEPLSSTAIAALASTFATRLSAAPAISQAEIQGYLIGHKDRPRHAVDGIEAWLENRARRMLELEQQRAKWEAGRLAREKLGSISEPVPAVTGKDECGSRSESMSRRSRAPREADFENMIQIWP